MRYTSKHKTSNLVVDEKTGERVRISLEVEHEKHGFGVNWISQNQAALPELIRARLPSAAWGVLMTIVALAEFNNAAVPPVQDICQLTGISQASVARALARLRELGVLIPRWRSPDGEVSRSQILNPSFAWKGNPESHKKGLQSLSDRPPMKYFYNLSPRVQLAMHTAEKIDSLS